MSSPVCVLLEMLSFFFFKVPRMFPLTRAEAGRFVGDIFLGSEKTR